MNQTLTSALADDQNAGLASACERLLDLLRSEAQALSESDVARVGQLAAEKEALLTILRRQIETRPLSELDEDVEAVVRQCQRQNAINGVTLGLTRNHHRALLRALRNEETSPVYAPAGEQRGGSSRSLGCA